MREKPKTYFEDPPIAKFLFSDTRLSWIWLPIRVYVGWQWLEAGIQKVQSPVWVGSHAGVALQGFVLGAFKKTLGPHPDVASWYASFLHAVVIPHAALFSYLVSFGEVAVGIGLILGIFTGIAAFFGAFMNMNYLFAGTVSVNPLLFLFELFLILSWKVAGWYGLDRYLLPLLGTPWQAGVLFKKK